MTTRKPKWNDCTGASHLRLEGLTVSVYWAEVEDSPWYTHAWFVEVKDARGVLLSQQLEGLDEGDRDAAKCKACRLAFDALWKRAGKLLDLRDELAEVSP